MEKRWDKPYKNPVVIFWFGLLVVVLIVNFFMISTAFVTMPGLTNKKYSEKGRHYEEVLAQRDHMKALGWQSGLQIPAVKVNQEFVVKIKPVDQDGHLLELTDAKLFIYRPLEDDLDAVFKFEKQGDAWYAKAKVPLKGQWDVLVEYHAKGEKNLDSARIMAAE